MDWRQCSAAFGREGSDWAANIRDCVEFARYRGPYFFNSIALSDRFAFPDVTTPRILSVSRTSVLHTGDETITVSGVRLSRRTEFCLGGLRALLVERRVGTRFELRVPFDLRVEGPVKLTAAHPVTLESSAAPELVTITFPRPGVWHEWLHDYDEEIGEEPHAVEIPDSFGKIWVFKG